MGLAGMGMDTIRGSTKAVAWQTGDVPATPERESLQTAAARLLAKLREIDRNLCRIDAPEQCVQLPEEKSMEQPGLEALLGMSWQLAMAIDAHLGTVADKIGRL